MTRFATPDRTWQIDLIRLDCVSPPTTLNAGAIPVPTHDGEWLAISRSTDGGPLVLAGYWDNPAAMLAALPDLAARWAEVEPVPAPPRPHGRNLRAVA